MTAHQTLVARIALSCTCAALSVMVVSSRRLFDLERKRFEQVVRWSFLISRLGLFSLIFFVLRIAPRGDVVYYYFPEAAQTLKGLMPYRDFVSSYAPLHSYLDSIVIRLWFSPLAIILLAIGVEALLLPLWFQAGKSFLSEEEMRRGALWYLTSAFSLQFVAIDGQDNVILAVLLALSILLLWWNRALLSGLVVGFGIAAIKFLPLIYGPAYFFSMRRRWTWAFGMAAVVVVVYGGFAGLRLPILQPLGVESALRSAGNLPFVVEGLTGVHLPSAIYDGLLLLVVGALCSLLAIVSRGASDQARLRALTFCIVAITMAVVMLAKKSWPAYFMLCLFPIGTMIDTRQRVTTGLFSFLTALAVVEHSYWAGFLDSVQANDFHQRLMAVNLPAIGFLVIEILLLAYCGWLLIASTREILSLRVPVDVEIVTVS